MKKPFLLVEYVHTGIVHVFIYGDPQDGYCTKETRRCQEHLELYRLHVLPSFSNI